MMKTYLLAFSDDLGTQEEIKNCIDSMPLVYTWRYDMTNAFYIISEASAVELYSQFRENINSSGRYIITEVGKNKQGWLTKDSWYLMRHKQHMPEK